MGLVLRNRSEAPFHWPDIADFPYFPGKGQWTHLPVRSTRQKSYPFPEYSFDAVICSNSFHHYPNPQAFFNSAYRILRKGGRLVLRDYTSSDLMVWLMNHLEMPLANLFGHGDVRIRKPAEFTAMAEKAGFTVLTIEKQKGFRAHLVARK